MDITSVSSNPTMTATTAAAPAAATADTPAPPQTTDTVTLSAAAKAVVPDPLPLDLSGKDLRQTDLKSLNLRGANLSGANLSGMDLSGLDFSGAVLTNADLTNVTARNADFSSCHIEDTKLNNGVFSGAKFDKALITTSDLGTTGDSQKARLVIWNASFDNASFKDTAFQRVDFENAIATNADFSGMTANAGMSYIGQPVSFTGCTLTGANFDQASGVHLAFNKSDLSNAKLTNLSLTYDGWTAPPVCLSISASNLSGTKFAGTSFDLTALTSDDLTKADLSGMTRSALGATIADTNMAGLDFSGFDFTGSHIDGLDRKSGSSGAGLSLKGTNFQYANFTYAYFADCTTSQTKGADFTGATFNQTLADDPASSTFAGQDGIRDAKSDAYDPAEGWIETLNKLGLDSTAASQSHAATELERFCMQHGAGNTSAATVPASTTSDIDKALTILKDYAAGKGEKTDADKALAALKAAAKANVGNSAVLRLIKDAAEESQKYIMTRSALDHGKTAPKPAKPAATGTTVSLSA